MIKRMIVFIMLILLVFSIPSYSATTESETCVAPEYFSRNFDEKYNCDYNKFLQDIQDGFNGLPFPDTREKADLFIDVMQSKAYEYYEKLPMFLSFDGRVYDITKGGSDIKSSRIVLIIDAFSEKRQKFVVLTIWWDIDYILEREEPAQQEQKVLSPKQPRKSSAF